MLKSLRYLSRYKLFSFITTQGKSKREEKKLPAHLKLWEEIPKVHIESINSNILNNYHSIYSFPFSSSLFLRAGATQSTEMAELASLVVEELHEEVYRYIILLEERQIS